MCKAATRKKTEIGFQYQLSLNAGQTYWMGSILQYFCPALSHHLSLRSLFCLFLHRFYCKSDLDSYVNTTVVKLHAYTLKYPFQLTFQRRWWELYSTVKVWLVRHWLMGSLGGYAWTNTHVKWKRTTLPMRIFVAYQKLCKIMSFIIII